MLITCPQCRRHIRHHESACPFCGAARVENPNRRGLGLAVALGVAATFGCSGEADNSVATGGGSSITSTGGSTAQGGAAATGGIHSTAGTGGMGVNAYGAPPNLGGSSTTGGSFNPGSAVVAYAPPPAPPINGSK